MNYATIKPLSIENGPGIRVSLFVSGCRMQCPGCFNKEAQSFEYGEEFTLEVWDNILELLKNPHVSGLSILGGEPFEPENVDMLYSICKSAKICHPEKDIWVWTGRNWENIWDDPIMNYIDVLVDGPFIQGEKDLSLYFRGSRNQRVIDVKKSLEAGCAIRLAGDWK